MKFMKSIEHVEQPCITESKVMEQNASQIIVKVSMKYDGLSRINYLSIANTSTGWKITNITNTFI
jgi:hypothetical protein